MDLIEYIKTQDHKIDYNNKLFEIQEGDLLKYVNLVLRNQLSPKSAELAMKRAAPINVWNKIVRKLSRIYTMPVTRTTENPADQELIDYYVDNGLDDALGDMNENYNAYKWSSIEIFEDEELKRFSFRSIPSNQFLVYSTNEVNPMRVDGFIKFMGTVKTPDGRIKNKYWNFTDDYVSAFYGDKTEIPLESYDNPYGVIPFEYLSQSKYLLIPNPDNDTLQMVTLLPVLITDQNYGSFWLSFPIITVTDGDAENLPASPNMFWNLKSDSEERSASIGVVKAEPNLQAQMEHVIAQLSIWLDSRDIKPGTIGKMTAENFASGLSKVISEMDTLKNSKDQEKRFRAMEKKLWKKIAIMHNTLAPTGRLENRKTFSDPENLVVDIKYSEEGIVESRADKVARLSAEAAAGFMSRRNAIRELNPGLDDDAIDKILEEIELERGSTIEVNENGDEMAED